MTGIITNAELDTIEARAAKATEGNWEPSLEDAEAEVDAPWWIDGPSFVEYGDSTYFTRADALFITSARSDVPRLVAECRRLKMLMAFMPDETPFTYELMGRALGVDCRDSTIDRMTNEAIDQGAELIRAVKIGVIRD